MVIVEGTSHIFDLMVTRCLDSSFEKQWIPIEKRGIYYAKCNTSSESSVALNFSVPSQNLFNWSPFSMSSCSSSSHSLLLKLFRAFLRFLRSSSNLTPYDFGAGSEHSPLFGGIFFLI